MNKKTYAESPDDFQVNIIRLIKASNYSEDYVPALFEIGPGLYLICATTGQMPYEILVNPSLYLPYPDVMLENPE